MHLFLVGRYPGWWSNPHRLPKRVFKALSDIDESRASWLVHLPLRGQRRLGRLCTAVPSCFPLNCGV